MNEMSDHITNHLFFIVALVFLLCLVTIRIAYADLKGANYSINLNDGKPVIDEENFEFFPGVTVERDFFIENMGDKALYYKLFFSNIEGNLGEYLEIKITEDGKTVIEGKLTDYQKSNKNILKRRLEAYEKKKLHITFSLPTDVENAAKDETVEFDLKALAVWE